MNDPSSQEKLDRAMPEKVWACIHGDGESARLSFSVAGPDEPDMTAYHRADLCQENREKLREAVLRKIEAAETQSRSPDETLSWIGTSRRDAYHEVLALIEEDSP